jgi:hypothetical protein
MLIIRENSTPDIIIDGYSDNSNQNLNSNKKIVEIHHIYHNKDNQFNNDD